jgi:hypothetical protein
VRIRWLLFGDQQRIASHHQGLVKKCPGLFAHWKIGMVGSFI